MSKAVLRFNETKQNEGRCRMKQLFSLMLLCVGLSAIMVACGKNDGGSSPAAYPAGQCPAGQWFSSQYGCQAACPQQPTNPGLVYVNGQCVATQVTGNNYCQGGMIYTMQGCLSQCPNNPSMGYFPQTGQCVAAMTNGYPNNMYNNGMYNNGMYNGMYNNGMYNNGMYNGMYNNGMYNNGWPAYSNPGMYGYGYVRMF